MPRKKLSRFPSVSCEGTLMRKVNLFVEDFGHEAFLKALVEKVAHQYQVEVEVRPYSVRGGHGKALTELRQ